MDAHLIDSAIFGHNWSTEESRALFSETGRTARWLRVIQALAQAQAELGIIPASSADAITALEVSTLDINNIALETRRTSHSALGLIAELRACLPEHAREHVYYGTTVQDITDNSAVLEIAEIGQIVWRDLRAIEALILELSLQHTDTPMLGRTHGQPGAPITFGFKTASWADEIGRHLQRLRQARPRLLVGQLAGAVGVLGFYGDHGIELRKRFCSRLGLADPGISWLTARDRIAELASIAAIFAATLARIANEVYNLQRLEIAELAEKTSTDTVGSITMPHKQNPENSEQIVVLARMIRSLAGLCVETMVGDHERDGRTWKAEWVLLPELGHYLLTALRMCRTLLEELEVNTAAMQSNLLTKGSYESQELLRRFAQQIGKHAAQERLQEVYRKARRTGSSLEKLIASATENAKANKITAGDDGVQDDEITSADDAVPGDGVTSADDAFSGEAVRGDGDGFLGEVVRGEAVQGDGDGFTSADDALLDNAVRGFDIRGEAVRGDDFQGDGVRGDAVLEDDFRGLDMLSLGQARQMVEAVVASAQNRRGSESDQWT